MSKKKSFTGSTMTLKDFHGGSIPSDLPLPSAPGVPARPPDRWGPPPIGIRHDTRQRPGSAGGVGTRSGSGFGSVVDDRGPPFLSTQANIGRNFDEDERKPFDASAGFTRRLAGVSDPLARPATVAGSARSDQKPVAVPASRASGVGPAQNAWGVKPVVDSLPPVSSNSLEDRSLRFTQASAIDKVSSGRWLLSKPVTLPPVEEKGRVVDEGKTRMVLNEEKTGPVSDEGRVVRKWQTMPASNEGRVADEGKRRPVSDEGRVVDEWIARPVSNEGRVVDEWKMRPVSDEGRVVDEWKMRPVSDEGTAVDEWKMRPMSNEGRVLYEGKMRPMSKEERFSGRMQVQEQQRIGVDTGERMKMTFLPRMKGVETYGSCVLGEKQV